MMQLADVDLRDGKYVVTSSSVTDDVEVVANGWFRIVGSDAPAAELGTLVLEALDNSKWQVPMASVSGEEAFSQVLTSLGLASTDEYMIGAKEVAVERQADGLTLLQAVNQGGSFHSEKGDEERHLPLATSPEELGRHVQEILAL